VFFFLPVNVDLSIADLAFTMEFGRAEVVLASLVALLERGVEGVEDSCTGADTIPTKLLNCGALQLTPAPTNSRALPRAPPTRKARFSLTM